MYKTKLCFQRFSDDYMNSLLNIISLGLLWLYNKAIHLLKVLHWEWRSSIFIETLRQMLHITHPEKQTAAIYSEIICELVP